MASPFILSIFGQMHAGKTFNLEELINKTSRTKIVYNYGQEKDWRGYEPIELIEDKNKLYFIHKGRKFLFESSFMKKFKGKSVKIETVFDSKPLRLFYIQVARIGSTIQNAFLVMEDATSVFNPNLTMLERSFLSRCKHSDVKVALCSHDLHYYPKQLWGLTTHVRLFKTTNPPPHEKRKIIPCFEELTKAWEVLQDAPKWSYYTLDVNAKSLIYSPYKSSK